MLTPPCEAGGTYLVRGALTRNYRFGSAEGTDLPVGTLDSTGLAGVTGHLWLTLLWGPRLGGGFLLEGRASGLVCWRKQGNSALSMKPVDPRN